MEEREIERADLWYELDYVTDSIITFAADGRIETVNQAATRMFGYRTDELVGRSVAILMLDTDHPGAGTKDMVGRRRDGSSFPVQLEVRACGDGEDARFIGIFRDLDAMKQRQRQADDELLLFRQIAENLEDVFFMADVLTGQVIYVSPAFEWVFGRDPSQALDPGAQPITWVHPSDRARLLQGWTAFQRGDLFDVEHRILQPTGGVRTVRTRLFRLSEPYRVAGVVYDVTEQRLLEAELRQARKLDAIGALASGIAHDFNNMLMGIMGFATVALQRLDAAHPAYPLVKRTVDVAGRGKMLTRHLLDFSRKRQPDRVPLDLDAVIADCRPLLETLVGDHVEVIVRTEALGCRVYGDAAEIEQMLMNLATNARDSMLNGGSLEVTTQEMLVRPDGARELPKGRYAELIVRDTGCGMDEPTLARLFEPFFTTKHSGRGTGLGLSNVNAIVQRMGGRISVASRLGVGTTVTVLLPVLPETTDIELPDGLDLEATILIVEDDPNVRTTVAHYVENLGYRSVVAATPPEAKRIAHERGERIDVLLTDVMLPHQLGTDLARELRSELPHLRVAFMSAHEKEELLESNRIHVGDALLQKPFDQRRLARVLHQLLDR